MSKSEKIVKKPRGQYNDKLTVKGSFLDIMNAAVKDASIKAPKSKKKEDETD